MTSSSSSSTDAQMQMQLERDAKAWAQELESDLDLMQNAERRMSEITQLLTTFSLKVAEQEETLSTIYQNTSDTTSNIDQGNTELLEALSRGSRSAKLLVMFFLGAAFSLLFLEWMA